MSYYRSSWANAASRYTSGVLLVGSQHLGLLLASASNCQDAESSSFMANRRTWDENSIRPILWDTCGVMLLYVCSEMREMGCSQNML